MWVDSIGLKLRSVNESDPLLDHPEGQDVVTVDAETELRDLRDASGTARIWMWIAPIAVVHLALIYLLARSIFDFEVPAYANFSGVVAWLWVNGAAIGLAAWFWRKDRVPLVAGKWLRGRRSRWLIMAWLGASLAWFVFPTVLSDAWHMLLPRLSR